MALFLVFYFLFIPGGIVLFLIVFRFVLFGLQFVAQLVNEMTNR